MCKNCKIYLERDFRQLDDWFNGFKLNERQRKNNQSGFFSNNYKNNEGLRFRFLYILLWS